MLVARAERELGEAHLLATLVFAGGLWASVVERTGLVLDTRYAPAERGDARRGRCLYLVVQGRFVLHGAAPDRAPTTFEGPVALALSEEQLEGAHGLRALTFRLEGEPFIVCELHFGEDATYADDATPCVVSVGHAAWTAACRLVEAARTGDQAAIVAALRSVIQALADAGHVSPCARDDIERPLRYEALWTAVRPLAQRLAMSSTVDEVGVLASLSSRHIARHLRSFFDAFPSLGGGFRPALVHMRVKIAVLFLSARDARVADVAKLVGYGSAEAMSRAFRDAGIPSPSAIRAALVAAR